MLLELEEYILYWMFYINYEECKLFGKLKIEDIINVLY